MRSLYAKIFFSLFCLASMFSSLSLHATAVEAKTSQTPYLLADTIPTPGTVGQAGGDRPTQAIRPGNTLAAVLDGLWNRFTRIFYIIITIYAIITLTQASLRYGGAQGDMKKVAEARSSIIQTVLAIALLTASVTVVSIIWAFTRSFV